MSAAAVALQSFLGPLMPGWSLQFGRWIDEGPQARCAVIKPAGGAVAELVRRPQLTLSLVGLPGENLQTSAAADAVVEALRASGAGLVCVRPSEPVYVPTSDGRPVFEIALEAITT